jgi:predicted nucleic acid-binding protein
MNGIDYLIDTNILIYILQGNPVVKYFAQEEFLAISCITEMEVQGKYNLLESEKSIITRVLEKCHIIDINYSIKQLTIQIKQAAKVKLPDAIIAATAIQQGLTLVTADKGFSKIKNLDLLLISY